jgi:hypothetical protein
MNCLNKLIEVDALRNFQFRSPIILPVAILMYKLPLFTYILPSLHQKSTDLQLINQTKHVMKKVFLIGSLLIAGIIGANAQKSFTFGAGINAGLPIGDASNISSFAVGGELQGELKFTENVSAVFTTGYTHFIGKDLGLGIKISYAAVPILAGVRYYPTEKFFVGAQIGYGFFTGDAEGGGFAYKPQVGYDAGKVQLALSYNAISDNGTISWLGLSGIFKFGGSKK